MQQWVCLTYSPLRIYAIGLEIWEWRVTTALHSAPQTNVLSHTIRVCIPVLLLIRYELNHTTTSLKKVLSPTFCAADMEFHVSAEIQSQRTHAYKRIGTRDYVCTEDNVDLMHISEPGGCEIQSRWDLNQTTSWYGATQVQIQRWSHEDME